jgi:nitroreductase
LSNSLKSLRAFRAVPSHRVAAAPIKNIENNPMQSSRRPPQPAVWTENLTRRANQRHKFIIPEFAERLRARNIDAIMFRVAGPLRTRRRRLREGAETAKIRFSKACQGNSAQMQFDDVILGRRSIRGYKPDPVPKALIAEIIGLAMRAPSSMNTQPWNFYVISGEPLDRIRAGNTERMVAGIPQSREFRTGQAFAGKHRDRQVGVAKQLFSAMGIERDNKDKRQDWVLRGFRQFDAPVCVIITYDRVLDGSDDTPFDCGAVATALVNAAWSRGLGAVINSQGIMQSPVVREHAGIADDQVIMKSIALGWPDETFPANAVVSERKSVEEATVFVGFEK